MRLQNYLAATAVAAALSATPALAEDLVFMLDNQSSGAIQEFYASPVGVDNWEEDILGADILPSQEASRITIADGRSVCEYDLKVVFDDGEELEERNINLCETGSYTVSD